MADKANITGTVKISDGISGELLADLDQSLNDNTVTKHSKWRDTYDDGNTPTNIIPSGFTTVQVVVIQSDQVIDLKLKDAGAIQSITGKLFIIFGGDYTDIQIDNNSGATAIVNHLLGAV